MRSMRRRFLAPALALAAVACAAAEPAVDHAAEEQAIRATAAALEQAVAANDPAAIAALYTEDGYIAPPGGDHARGREAVTAVWARASGLPGVALDVNPMEVVVSRAGDLGYMGGTWTLSFDGEDGRVEDRGKFAVVLRKEAGEWKAMADIFNSSLPAQ